MTEIAPIGYERFPFPLNQVRKPVPVKSRPPLRRTEPIAAASLTSNQQDQMEHGSLERQFLLSVGTRRSLLEFDPEHPLNGPHPTD